MNNESSITFYNRNITMHFTTSINQSNPSLRKKIDLLNLK